MVTWVVFAWSSGPVLFCEARVAPLKIHMEPEDNFPLRLQPNTFQVPCASLLGLGRSFRCREATVSLFGHHRCYKLHPSMVDAEVCGTLCSVVGDLICYIYVFALWRRKQHRIHHLKPR